MKNRLILFILSGLFLFCKNNRENIKLAEAEMVEVIPKGSVLDVVIQGKPTRLKAYKIAKKEVSSILWKEVFDWAIKNGYKFAKQDFPSDELPITNITWSEAIVWCNARSEKDTLKPCYYNSKKEVIRDATNMDLCNLSQLDIDATGYRLPKEAEWEVAGRGGNPDSLSWNFTYAGGNNLDELGWYIKNSNAIIHISGQKLPNSLGLYDMSGNVWEWCYDWYNKEETARVNRGGGIISPNEFCKLSENGSNFPDTRDPHLGFRLAISIN